MDIYVLK